MGKRIEDQKLSKNLKEFFSSETYSGAKREIKEIENVIRQINELVRTRNIEQVKELNNSGISKKEISIKLEISLSTVYRYLKKE